jgi:hypothetical protein
MPRKRHTQQSRSTGTASNPVPTIPSANNTKSNRRQAAAFGAPLSSSCPVLRPQVSVHRPGFSPACFRARSARRGGGRMSGAIRRLTRADVDGLLRRPTSAAREFPSRRPSHKDGDYEIAQVCKPKGYARHFECSAIGWEMGMGRSRSHAGAQSVSQPPAPGSKRIRR